MEQLPPPPPPASTDLPPDTAPATLQPVAAPRRWYRAPALWAIVAVVVLAAAGLIAYNDLARSLDGLRAQLAGARSDLITETARSTRIARDAEARADELARDLDQVKSQRAALDQLYLDLARGRDEATLLDVERLISLASQDLRFTGFVPGALTALQAADARLARMDRPQYLGLRRALAHDIEKLRAIPVVDLTGIALKLDQIGQSVDTLPLLGDPVVRPARPAPAAVAPAAPSIAAKAGTAWERVREWMADEFGDLVRIREVETPDALLLNGMQQQLVRSQLRLRLLDARQALLARNERVFRADLGEAQALLTRYFDVKGPAAGATMLQLRQLAQSTLSVEVPTLDESLAAIRVTRPALAPAPSR